MTGPEDVDDDPQPVQALIDANAKRRVFITAEDVQRAARRVHTEYTIDIAVAAGRPITAWLLRRMLRTL